MTPEEPASDTAIMQQVQSGDADCFGLIVRRYQRALLRVAASRLGREDLAEEAVQETFLAAFKARHTYDSDFAFRTWLWTILLNKCKLLYARSQRRKASIPWSDAFGGDDEGQDRGPACKSPQPASQLLAKEQAQQLEQLLVRLSPSQADALRLRFFGGLSFPEIARTMRCSLGTAKNRVKWGLERLSAMIGQDEAVNPSKAQTAEECELENEGGKS